MKYIIIVFAVLLISCTKQASNQLASEETKRGGNHGHQAEATLATITLTHVSGSNFTLDYGGATDVVWVFMRSGSELYSNGNVIPSNTQSWYLNPVTNFTTWVSGTYYQVVVATGSTVPVNGVVGADWIMNYSNVVQ